MIRTIEVDINNTNDLFEKYNYKEVSHELIDYLINSASILPKNENIKIIINNRTDEKELTKTIHTALEKEYSKSLKKHYHNNVIQFIYLIIGILGLFLSTFITTDILKEIIIIGAWVFIWALVEMEIFGDYNIKKRSVILKRLINCELIEK